MADAALNRAWYNLHAAPVFTGSAPPLPLPALPSVYPWGSAPLIFPPAPVRDAGPNWPWQLPPDGQVNNLARFVRGEDVPRGWGGGSLPADTPGSAPMPNSAPTGLPSSGLYSPGPTSGPPAGVALLDCAEERRTCDIVCERAAGDFDQPNVYG